MSENKKFFDGLEKVDPADVVPVLPVDKGNYTREHCAANHLQPFRDMLKCIGSITTPRIPTGFPVLDDILNGGLYAGLFVLGAVTSLGKTTYALQIADQLAADGQDVLFISLEMGRNELIAKSISRETYLQSFRDQVPITPYAKTTASITNGENYKRYETEELDIISKAIDCYAGCAGRVFIHEGQGRVQVEKIGSLIKEHKQETGNVPVVIVDYLQLLSPDPKKAGFSSERQNIDHAMTMLKQYSRDHETPIIAISSLNRAAYQKAKKDNPAGGIELTAFKESGGIEYSADVLMALQYHGAEEDGHKQAHGFEDDRQVDLKILKQRGGRLGVINYTFHAMFNNFEETGEDKKAMKPKAAKAPGVFNDRSNENPL